MENNRFHSASFRKALSPWLFMLPGIIFTVWLRYYPIIKSFYMSLFSQSTGTFCGISELYQSVYRSLLLGCVEKYVYFPDPAAVPRILGSAGPGNLFK